MGPHGGELVNTVITDAALKKKLIAEASATIELSERQACDVALLSFGGFSPLDGFMKQADYDGVVGNMRLANGVLFSLPVVLDVTDTSLQGKKVLLKYNGVDMAVMEAEEVWKPNKVKEAKSSYGTTSMEHPSVQELFESLGKYYVGGKVHGLMTSLNDVWGSMGKAFKTPAEVRKDLRSHAGGAILQKVGWRCVPVGVPSLLHENGWATRGYPAHDHPEEFWRHALYHRS